MRMHWFGRKHHCKGKGNEFNRSYGVLNLVLPWLDSIGCQPWLSSFAGARRGEYQILDNAGASSSGKWGVAKKNNRGRRELGVCYFYCVQYPNHYFCYDIYSCDDYGYRSLRSSNKNNRKLEDLEDLEADLTTACEDILATDPFPTLTLACRNAVRPANGGYCHTTVTVSSNNYGSSDSSSSSED